METLQHSESNRIPRSRLLTGLSDDALVANPAEYRGLRVWAAWCRGVWLIRGLPHDTKGEPTDFTAVAEPSGQIVIVHLGERIDSKDKIMRLKSILRMMGFTRAQAWRNGKKKDYRL